MYKSLLISKEDEDEKMPTSIRSQVDATKYLLLACTTIVITGALTKGI